MNCIIIDDEMAAQAIIKELCNQTEGLSVTGEFTDAIQAIKYLNHNQVDLVFLDIHMPTFSGLDFIQTIKSPPLVVFTTSDPTFAIEAFEYDFIVDYLIKPIYSERFEKAISKVKKSLQSNPPEVAKLMKEESSENNLYVNIDRRLIKIDISSIYLVEAKGDYINIKTEDKTYTVHSTLKKIEEKLSMSNFLKVHRSFIININKIVDIENNSVLIKRDVIPVSRSNRPELMKRLNLL